jgi:hypothetical protein
MALPFENQNLRDALDTREEVKEDASTKKMLETLKKQITLPTFKKEEKFKNPALMTKEELQKEKILHAKTDVIPEDKNNKEDEKLPDDKTKKVEKVTPEETPTPPEQKEKEENKIEIIDLKTITWEELVKKFEWAEGKKQIKLDKYTLTFDQYLYEVTVDPGKIAAKWYWKSTIHEDITIETPLVTISLRDQLIAAQANPVYTGGNIDILNMGKITKPMLEAATPEELKNTYHVERKFEGMKNMYYPLDGRDWSYPDLPNNYNTQKKEAVVTQPENQTIHLDIQNMPNIVKLLRQISPNTQYNIDLNTDWNPWAEKTLIFTKDKTGYRQFKVTPGGDGGIWKPTKDNVELTYLISWKKETLKDLQNSINKTDTQKPPLSNPTYAGTNTNKSIYWSQKPYTGPVVKVEEKSKPAQKTGWAYNTGVKTPQQ